ncbi:hypothetical protein EI94DRAFT_1772410 [Lactarius quietus]|nr:hypothetical protein EI94DRAFT_1772410 [Lactarius quietus]
MQQVDELLCTSLSEVSPNDWAPYHDHVDFELTEFLYTKLWRASLINHGIHPDDINLFEWNDIGDVPWEGFSMSYDGPCPLYTPEWMTTTHNLVHNLLANWDFDGEFDYMPFQEFDTWKSGNWAWKEANIIANDPDTHGLLLITVSVATGQNEYYPLYLSIGNVHNNVRPDKRHTDDCEYCRFCRQLFYSSLANILSSLRPTMTIPEVARTPDGHSHHIIYSLGPYIADYPEQALLACVVQGWCPRCTTQSEGLVSGEHCSQELTNALVNAYQYGIVANVMPFTSEFPRADIHEIIAPDILHQVIKGTFKDHLVLWVELYLVCMHGKSKASAILDDIDCR